MEELFGEADRGQREELTADKGDAFLLDDPALRVRRVEKRRIGGGEGAPHRFEELCLAFIDGKKIEGAFSRDLPRGPRIGERRVERHQGAPDVEAGDEVYG